MNAQTIESRPAFPVVAALCAVGGVALMAMAVISRNANFAVGGVGPLALALGLWLSRPKPFHAELTPTGLKIIDEDAPLAARDEDVEEIPYADIESLTIGGATPAPDDARIRPGPLFITHKHGTLEIPKRSNVPPAELYRHLLGQIPQTGSRQVHAKLAPYVREQEETFGADRVITYVRRGRLAPARTFRRARTCLALLAATGVVWIAIPLFVELARGGPSPWIGVGIGVAAVSLFVLLILRLVRTQGLARQRRWQNPSLAVSPVGIAMVQGDLSGQMRWDEIRDIHLGKRPRHFSLQHETLPSQGLHLVIEGALLQVADVYDRPLATIYSVLRRYWRPE